MRLKPERAARLQSVIPNTQNSLGLMVERLGRLLLVRAVESLPLLRDSRVIDPAGSSSALEQVTRSTGTEQGAELARLQCGVRLPCLHVSG